MAEGNGLGPCAHESSGELDESEVGPERLHPWAQGDGSTARPQTTLRLGIKRPEDHCFLFLATKCLTRNEVTTETGTKLESLNCSHMKPLPLSCLVLAVFPR